MSRVVIISRGMRSSVVAVLLDDEGRITAAKSTFLSRNGRGWSEMTYPLHMLAIVDEGVHTELRLLRKGHEPVAVHGTESAKRFEGRDRRFFLLDRGLEWPFPEVSPTAESEEESRIDTADAERRAEEWETVHESEMTLLHLRGRR